MERARLHPRRQMVAMPTEIAARDATAFRESAPAGEATLPVVVIEDNRLLRDGIAAILNGQLDLKVVSVAESLEQAVVAARETKPRVILVDAALGNEDSGTWVECLRKAAPEAKVIVMGVPPASDDIVELVGAGASGFIVKDATIEELIAAVRSVAAGKEVLPSAFIGALFSHIAGHAVDRSAPDANGPVRLSRREMEVIDLIAEGLSNKEIARRLNVTTYTVKSHVHSILEKLALRSRLEIAARAHKLRLGAGFP